MAGMVSVPIYATAGTATIEYVLEHSEAKLLFIGRLDSDAAVKQASITAHTVSFPYPGIEADTQWRQWLADYEPMQDIATPAMHDLYTIVYTSGSTGKPKGVCLDGLNMASAAADLCRHIPEGKHRIMSYLPMAHITERSVVSMASLNFPVEIFFNESLDTFLNDVKHCEPTVFLSVPRLWSKFQAGILAQIPDSRLQFLLKVPFLGKRVAKKLREGLGLGSAKQFLSGSAPISAGLLRWYSKIGIDIAEGWGMSETSGAACANAPFNFDHIGTIGKSFPNVEMKVGEGGELLIRGDSIFKEYYKNPEATAEAWRDGWFHTGDCAQQNEDGAWVITGRVKEQFKTAKGKYVVPVPIESTILANVYVEQCCVVGSGKPQPLALLVLGEGFENKKAEVEDSLESMLSDMNGKLESHQRISNLVIVDETWSIENALLTPTLKLKRDAIESKYAELLENDFRQKLIWEADLA